MPIYEYKCETCGCDEQVYAVNPPEKISHVDCIHTECRSEMHRVWAPFHTGQGSSGERAK